MPRQIDGGEFVQRVRSRALPGSSESSPSDFVAGDDTPMHRGRIVIAGFQCITQTWDHALNVDGWADEVYLKCGVQGLDVEGRPDVPIREVITPIYGQAFAGFPFVQPVPGRIKAGAEPFGGIESGDTYPGSEPWLAQGGFVYNEHDRVPLPAVVADWVQSVDVPFTGTMVLTPSVWEYDSGMPLDPDWGNSEMETAQKVGGVIGSVSGALAAIPGLQPIAAFGAAVAGAFAIGATVLSAAKELFGEAGDRPIGQVRHEDGTRTYDPAVFVMDWSKVREAASVNNGFGPGVWPTTYEDSRNIGGGKYIIFLQVRYEMA